MREEGELRAGHCVRRERAREMRSGKEGGEGIEGSGRERIGRRRLRRWRRNEGRDGVRGGWARVRGGWALGRLR